MARRAAKYAFINGSVLFHGLRNDTANMIFCCRRVLIIVSMFFILFFLLPLIFFVYMTNALKLSKAP